MQRILTFSLLGLTFYFLACNLPVDNEDKHSKCLRLIKEAAKRDVDHWWHAMEPVYAFGREALSAAHELLITGNNVERYLATKVVKKVGFKESVPQGNAFSGYKKFSLRLD